VRDTILRSSENGAGRSKNKGDRMSQDRRVKERRSFDWKKRIVWTVPMEGEQEAIEGIERRKTIIKAGRRSGQERKPSFWRQAEK